MAKKQEIEKTGKKQWRLKLVEKNCKFTYWNLNGKFNFYPFSIPSSGTFVILYSSGKQYHFSTTFFAVSGGGEASQLRPAVAPE